MMRLVFAALLLGSCATVPPPSPGGSDCPAACERGKTLACPWASPTPNGEPCEAVCSSAMASPLPWSLECIARAGTCAEMDRCNY